MVRREEDEHEQERRVGSGEGGRGDEGDYSLRTRKERRSKREKERRGDRAGGQLPVVETREVEKEVGQRK